MEEEAEKQRFGEEEDAKLEEVNKTGMSIGELGAAGGGGGIGSVGGIGSGEAAAPPGAVTGALAGNNETEEDIENDNGPVVAVFGEDCYVEVGVSFNEWDAFTFSSMIKMTVKSYMSCMVLCSTVL